MDHLICCPIKTTELFPHFYRTENKLREVWWLAQGHIESGWILSKIFFIWQISDLKKSCKNSTKKSTFFTQTPHLKLANAPSYVLYNKESNPRTHVALSWVSSLFILRTDPQSFHDLDSFEDYTPVICRLCLSLCFFLMPFHDLFYCTSSRSMCLFVLLPVVLTLISWLRLWCLPLSLYCKVIFSLVIDKYFVGRYFEIMKSHSLLHIHPLLLASVDFLARVNYYYDNCHCGGLLIPSFFLYLLSGFLL